MAVTRMFFFLTANWPTCRPTSPPYGTSTSKKLSEYMASTGKRYQSHAATIRRWAGEDMKKAAPPTRNRDYSVKEDETV